MYQYIVMGIYTPLIISAFGLYIWCAGADPADPGVFKSKKYVKTPNNKMGGRVKESKLGGESMSSVQDANATSVSGKPGIMSSKNQDSRTEDIVSVSVKVVARPPWFMAVFAPCAMMCPCSSSNEESSELQMSEDGMFYCSLCEVEGSLGMSHQQALAQITSQASQVHTQSHSQLPQNYSFNSNATTYQRLPSSIPNHNTAKESSNLSNSDDRYQPPSIAVDKPADDGYNWRKYGQKQVKGSEYPRSYYKCTHPNCPVKKQVERSVEGLVTQIIYKGEHNHQPPQSKRGKDSNTGTSSQYEQGFEGQTSNFSHSRDGRSMHSLTMKDQESSQATYENSGSSDGEEVGDDVSRGDERQGDEPQAKRRNTEVRGSDPVSSHRTVTEPRIIVQTTSEVDLLDDGYRWRKYGQKVVKGNPHPRSYYKCTFQGCNVRKHVERAASDPKAVITTYEGKHTHDVPAAKNSSHNLAATTSLIQPPNHPPTGVHSLTRRPEYSNRQQPPQAGRLQFKEEQIT